jgi:hypothetical protein
LYAVLEFPGWAAFLLCHRLLPRFGYNRYLKVPEIDKLAEFPLVAQAMGGVSDNDTSETGELITEH